ncbi:chemotaxis protein MotA [Desulfonatronum thiosulfatophilum]|uniref:Chemotaxis protein MotA n=1 Tax=Desulfonatronum thiosulfatophilum TaxID=617002 RepID=A0A1G6C9R7_9BACT|nr:MotA/TolQ/ExbB proton channel family protein [Desulfonatronum thiosulfatophilum]SDB29531.1 chemotaxis protein MotA [Desulfonatronum thiosulfatophilum]
MDIGTLLGLISGILFVFIAIMLGGDFIGFLNAPSALIVIGGTVSVTFIMFPMGVVLGSFKVALKAFFSKSPNPQLVINEVVALANQARKESLVSLERATVSDKFLRKGILLIADGSEERLVRNILETELNFTQLRHRQGQGVFKGMGTMAPAFGMIGTLIGLVNMLQVLDDPTAIGPGMALALLTTLYGALMANLAFIPIAKKLEERSQEELSKMEMTMEGVMSILRGENPRLIQEKLESFMPPSMRQ